MRMARNDKGRQVIFARRAIQRRLDAIRDLLDEKDIGQLVRRLNNPGRDRMAAMWEVVVFSALGRKLINGVSGGACF